MSLHRFTDSYIEAALWSTNDESDEGGGRPLDENYGEDDIDPGTMEQMEQDCESFYGANAELWTDEHDDEKAGVDFWLTRNGHGAGYWDGDYTEGDKLTKAAEAFGEFNLYVGDDGLVYGE